VDYPIHCEVNRALTEKWDRIISVGQLVPHEVIGIANQTKNVFVGTGGKRVIDHTHFLGAVCNMERIMGRARTPVRDILEYMANAFAQALPITYLLTVREKVGTELVTRGLYAGDDIGCFVVGAELAREVNLDLLAAPLKKVVVYLDPSEFKSTWLGNKAVYRTRLALADGAELLILAPGVRTFGEDAGIPAALAAVKEDPELAGSLSAAAHLIHGSSEGRFHITYAAGGLTRAEVEGVGFAYAEVEPALARYNPSTLRDGFNVLPDGEEIFFISNPALGLWALREQFAS
jgi:nickel-dependent lactate racemase